MLSQNYHFSTYGLISISHVNAVLGCVCKCQYASAICGCQLIPLATRMRKTYCIGANLGIRDLSQPLFSSRDINHPIDHCMGNMNTLGSKLSGKRLAECSQCKLSRGKGCKESGRLHRCGCTGEDQCWWMRKIRAC